MFFYSIYLKDKKCYNKNIKRIDIKALDGIVEWFDNLLHEYQYLTNYSETRINRLCLLLNHQINKLQELITKENDNWISILRKI